MSGNPLASHRMPLAMQRIGEWRTDPGRAVACPVCESDGLTIEDRSARPHAEWYILTCNACGLQHTLHVPMAPLSPFNE